MFCSGCGKTVSAEDRRCPHCVELLSGARFVRARLTSAQAPVINAGVSGSRFGAVSDALPSRLFDEYEPASAQSRTGSVRPARIYEDYPEPSERDYVQTAQRLNADAREPSEDDAWLPAENEPWTESEEESWTDAGDEGFYEEPEQSGRYVVPARESRAKGGTAMGLAICAALIVLLSGVLVWLLTGFIAKAHIPGVTESLYQKGMQLISERASESYTQALSAVYDGGGREALLNRAAADAAEFDGLMPADPAANDALFVDALQAVQTDIASAVLGDRVDAQTGSATAAQDSQTRWAVVTSELAQLEQATGAEDLGQLVSAARIPAASTPAPASAPNGNTAPPATPTPEPTPEPTPTPALPEETLERGSKGDYVLQMQTRLSELGYLNDALDGVFGGKTQTALMQFQLAAGLEITGTGDRTTLTALYSDNAPAILLDANGQPAPLGLQEGPRVNDSYFNNTVFVGDSVTLKLYYYVREQRQGAQPDLLGNAIFLCAGSLGSGNVQQPITGDSIHPTLRGSKVHIDDAVAEVGAEKVYIMLGMNDLAEYGVEGSVSNMMKLIESIRAKSPNVQIYIQSATPRIRGKDQKTLNNANLLMYDIMLYRAVAALSSQNVYFVDVASVMRDADGYLPNEYCSDPEAQGVHFTNQACGVWIDYLYTHTA